MWDMDLQHISTLITKTIDTYTKFTDASKTMFYSTQPTFTLSIKFEGEHKSRKKNPSLPLGISIKLTIHIKGKLNHALYV